LIDRWLKGRWLHHAIAAALILAATDATARPFDEVIEDGTIVIAVYRDFPPFSFQQNGQLVGVDVDLGRHIASRLQVVPDFMVITADETMDDDLRNAVWKGHYLRREVADFMLHVPVDRQFALRNKLAAISSPYLRRELVTVFDPERIADATTMDSLSDETIGVELDSLADFFLSSAYGGQLRDNVIHFSTVGDATRGLLDGEVTAVMAPRSEIEAGLGTDHQDRFAFDPVTMPGFGRTTWDVGIAVDENSRDLGYAIGDIIYEGITDGEIERIFARYGISYRRPGDG
jgi:ABC-type amino acid transport substrate-binding protein